MSCYTHKMAILTILVYCDHRFCDVTSPYAYDKSIREGCDADCYYRYCSNLFIFVSNIPGDGL